MFCDKTLLAAIQMAMCELSFQNNFTKWNNNGIGKIVILQMVSVLGFYERTKKGVSALEMQRQLGHKRYRTIWVLMHKIRAGMGKRDDKYNLSRAIELDEGYFEVATPSAKKLKRGRGSQSKTNVAVMAESTPLVDIPSGKKTSQFRYAKMKALKTHKADEINGVASKNIDSHSSIITDKSTSYEDFSALFCTHVLFKSN
ncbi:MAG: hypothetical protein ACI837_000265 [Crocinitomicaceae bacterium]|jgi:hypothetical protein